MTPSSLDAPARRRAWPLLLLLTLAAVLGVKVYAELRSPSTASALAPAETPAAASSAGAAATVSSATGSSAASSASVSASVSASAASAAAAVAAAAAGMAPSPPVIPEPQWGQPAEAAARVARAASVALATARAAAGLGPAQPAEVVMDLCGVGRLTLPLPEGAAAVPGLQASWQRLPPWLAEQAQRQAWARVLAALSAPGQPDRARAAALAMRASGRAEDGSAPDPVSATRGLARLARTSPDATVIHWALATCSRESRASAECRRLSARDLVRLAPDDGLSWLALASRPGISAAERDRALQKAALAPAFGASAAQLAQVLDAVWPEDLPGYLRLQLLVTAQAVDTGVSLPGPRQALDLCSAGSLADAGHRSLCENLARRMLAQARDRAVLGVVAALGARLGWPDNELEPLKAEEAAVLQAEAAASAPGTDQPYACSAVESTRDWVGSVAADGEVQAWRRRLAIQPTTPRPAASRP